MASEADWELIALEALGERDWERVTARPARTVAGPRGTTSCCAARCLRRCDTATAG